MSIHSTDSTRPSERERKRRFWNEHILNQEPSGQAQREYCQCRGLSFNNFTRWLGLTLKARAADKAPATRSNTSNPFAPVQLVPAMPSSTADVDNSIALVLQDGTRIEGITDNNLSVATALIARL